MKIDNNSKNQPRIALFANKSEAIVFWLACTGLIFLAMISVFRYFYLHRAHFVAAENAQQIIAQIHTLDHQNDVIMAQNDSLKNELMQNQQKVENLTLDLIALKRKFQDIAIQVAAPEDSAEKAKIFKVVRSTKILNEFNIRRARSE